MTGSRTTPAAGGVVWPADMPGVVPIAPLVEPAGAGEGVADWAQAKPVLSIKAADASRILRMKNSF
jgi:hypothetical protein